MITEELKTQIKEYIKFLNENCFEETVRTKVSNTKIRNYFTDKFKEMNLNVNYIKLVKNSNIKMTFNDFIDQIPESEKEKYIKNKDLIEELLSTYQVMSSTRIGKIKMSKMLASDISKIDPIAKYIINYYKTVRYAELALQKHLKNMTVDEILEKYNFIKDFMRENND